MRFANRMRASLFESSGLRGLGGKRVKRWDHGALCVLIVVNQHEREERREKSSPHMYQLVPVDSTVLIRRGCWKRYASSTLKIGVFQFVDSSRDSNVIATGTGGGKGERDEVDSRGATCGPPFREG